MAALTVEHLKVLMVEPPKGSLSVEPPKGSLSVEPMAALLVERATHPVGPLFWGRGCLFGEGPQKRVAPSSHVDGGLLVESSSLTLTLPGL